MMFYGGYHFLGMHLLWWFFWIFFIISIVTFLKKIAKNRNKKETPLDLLKNRFAAGFINNEEYLEKKKLLENDSTETQ